MLLNLKTSFSAFLLLISIPVDAVAGSDPTYGVTIKPHQPHTVRLSNQDINRVVCMGGEIGAVRFSQEKGIQTDQDGPDLFIKFQMQQLGSQLSYVTARSEFFIECAGTTFTLKARPSALETQTIFLDARGEGRRAQAAALFAPMSQEQRLLMVTKAVLTETYGDAYKTERFDPDLSVSPFPGVFTGLLSRTRIEALGLVADTWLVASGVDIELSELMFLRPDFGEGIQAVTVSRAEMSAGEQSRVVIVRAVGGRY